MKEGFDVQLSMNDFDPNWVKHYQQVGLSIYNGIGFPSSCKKQLTSELLKNVDNQNQNTIDGSKIKDIWFPRYKKQFDIFLSHSHDDILLALTLAGYLKEKFDLNPFIDSFLWGYVDELQSKIDERVCQKNSDGNYLVSERNKTTAHVHMMLLTSLVQAMEDTRCLFFLNTDKSTSIEQGQLMTYSPWIHVELYMYQLLKRNKDCKLFSLCESLSIVHKADTSGLVKLTRSSFQKWFWQYELLKSMQKTNVDSVDLLVMGNSTTSAGNFGGNFIFPKDLNVNDKL